MGIGTVTVMAHAGTWIDTGAEIAMMTEVAETMTEVIIKHKFFYELPSSLQCDDYNLGSVYRLRFQDRPLSQECPWHIEDHKVGSVAPAE